MKGENSQESKKRHACPAACRFPRSVPNGCWAGEERSSISRAPKPHSQDNQRSPQALRDVSGVSFFLPGELAPSTRDLIRRQRMCLSSTGGVTGCFCGAHLRPSVDEPVHPSYQKPSTKYVARGHGH